MSDEEVTVSLDDLPSYIEGLIRDNRALRDEVATIFRAHARLQEESRQTIINLGLKVDALKAELHERDKQLIALSNKDVEYDHEANYYQNVIVDLATYHPIIKRYPRDLAKHVNKIIGN